MKETKYVYIIKDKKESRILSKAIFTKEKAEEKEAELNG